MKKCPYCAEDIQTEAIVCRYCGRDLQKPEQNGYQTKRTELIKILTEESAFIKQRLKERQEMWNSEFDGIKTAENMDRGIQSLIAPLSVLFRGKKKYTEEHRVEWVGEKIKDDLNVRLLNADLLISDGYLKGVEADKFSLSEIEDLIKDHIKKIQKLKRNY